MNANPFTILRTPSPSSTASSSESGRFDTLKQKKMSHKVRRDSHKEGGNLWSPAKGWLTYYRCSTCKEVMTRKDPAKCPQKIHACEHIVCAKCIVKSFLIELNPACPVKDCGKCVNPRTAVTAKPAVALPLFFTTDIIPCDLFDEEPVATERVHFCGDRSCEWDCGTLDCGCIDQCRGRCGLRDWGW